MQLNPKKKNKESEIKKLVITELFSEQNTTTVLKAPASNENILAKYVKYHLLLSWIVSQLFKGIFV